MWNLGDLITSGQLMRCATLATLSVVSVPAFGQTFCNTDPIIIGDVTTATPYPSSILVSNVPASIQNVTVTLNNITHGFIGDLDVLLVGPTGQKVILMSDIADDDLTGAANLTFTFADGSPLLPGGPPVVSGTFSPTNIAEQGTEFFPAPAPAPPHGSALTDFYATNPNGTWQLFVVDDFIGGIGSIAGGWCLNITPVMQDRVSGSEKGSLLIFPDVELKWTGAAVVQDTFIKMSNDNSTNMYVQFYFINGDPPLAQQPPLPAPATERAHPGWNNIDNLIDLTADQPSYWSLLTGQPGSPAPAGEVSISPFTVLDPGPLGFAGRPDLDPGAPAGARYLRGFIIAFAMNSDGDPISWNHLTGSATIVNYRDGSAWEYNAYAFQCVDPLIPTGGVIGIAGSGFIDMDGIHYAKAFDQLLMNFQAVGATAFNLNPPLGAFAVTTNADLTLCLVSTDLRQNNAGPRTTKAQFDVWNQNEVKFSNAERCITCWHQGLLGTWAPFANHFTRANLQTNVGKARIDGVSSPVVCNNPLFVSTFEPLLGVMETLLTFNAGVAFAEAGTNLFGLGTQNAQIRYDVTGGEPPPASAPKSIDESHDEVQPATATAQPIGVGGNR